MHSVRLFIDTHDRDNGTFPQGITDDQFREFFGKYNEACLAEGVILLDIKVGLGAGRAFCLTLAPDAEAVRRAHARVGLPFGTITEVETASPGSLFFKATAA